tara:strand:+ start:94 stop:456 length:363 start_codon:yes stop_codon:yes gene_type:complete
MEKFISFRNTAGSIAGGINVFPSADVATLVQTSTSRVTIAFKNHSTGYDTLLIDHTPTPVYAAATPEQCTAMRDLLTATVASSLSTGWTSPIFNLVIPGPTELVAGAAGTQVTITAITWQ